MGSVFKTVGRQFQINSSASGDQAKPNIDANPATGGFQVVWQSFGQDGDGWGIYAQNFRADARAQGDEIAVNTITLGDQTTPDIAFNEDGNGVWIWETNAILENLVIDPDTGRTTVGDRDDDPIARDIATSVRTHTKSFGFEGEDYFNVEKVRHGGHIPEDEKFSLDPRIISLGGDQFGSGSRDNDIARGGTQYLVDEFSTFTPATVPRNGDWSRNFAEDEVNPRPHTTFGDIGQVNDDTIVAVNTMTLDFDGALGIIQFQFFDRPDNDRERGLAFGLSERFVLEGSGETGPAANPRVAVLEDGGFAITWQEQDQSAEDEADWHWDVYAQIFEADGSARSPVVAVHDASAADQTGPEIAALNNGDFAIAYSEGRGTNVSLQRFDPTGVRLGDVTTVNSAEQGDQGEAALTVLNNGRVVVTWESSRGDGDGSGVFGQVLSLKGTGAKTAQTIVGTDANERFSTGAKNDVVDGGGGRDVILGGGKNDVLRGGAGNDKVFGGSGSDIVDGGLGNDQLRGNGGPDTFVYGAGNDRILDFQDDIDTLQLDAALGGETDLNPRLVLRLAEDTDAGVLFDFGRDELLVRNMTVAEIRDDIEIV